jgi:phosphatidylserine/phosphatidylglycerophosphate/cardiolipin synthase-like enzyme
MLVQAYLLYSTRLAGALVRAKQRGVQVHVIRDANAQPHHPPVSAVALLVAAGIAVSLDVRHAWAHEKVMILDGRSSSPAPIIGRSPRTSITARISW